MFTIGSLRDFVAKRMPADHPLHRIKAEAEKILASLDRDFDALYSDRGRSSIPPEQLLLACLWQALFSIRSERLLEDTLRFDLRCRWFVGLPLEKDAWDHSSFSKARESFLLQTVAQMFFERHREFLRAENLLSSEHLSVDGTLLAAWASPKSLVRRDEFDKDGKPPKPPEGGRNGWVDFKGEKRSNETHVSASDPEARLASKGNGTKLSHEMSVLAENRNNFVVGFTVMPPTGTSEREAARALIAEQRDLGFKPKTVGADKKYSDGDSLTEYLANECIEPHFAVRDDRPNALARIFQNEPGYQISQRCRMRIEEVMGFIKTVCGLAKLKVRGVLRVFGAAAVAVCAYNLRRHASF
jgi:transposase